jgi:hypothetical protein
MHSERYEPRNTARKYRQGGETGLSTLSLGRPHFGRFARHTAFCGISVPKQTGAIVYSAASVFEQS